MSKQIFELCRLQLCNLFGMNEIRHTKDKAKRGRFIGLAVVWVLLIAMLAGYVGGFVYGFVTIGMTEIVPMYLYAVSSLLILIFSFFKAGSTIFAMKGYEMLISLPVSLAAIIISRFFCMYVTNLMMGLLILLPGIGVYGYFVRPSAGFYTVFFFGTLFLPLLPLTISSILGAAITAAGARSRHKSLVETLLMLVFVTAVLGGSMFLSGHESELTEEMLKNLAEVLSVQIGRVYPPSVWFGEALSGDTGALILLIAVPAAVFALFVIILQKYFQSICAAIHAVSAKNNYKMTSLKQSSHILALWKKELKRYFSSSIYVTNTIIGYVMAVIASAGFCFLGIKKIESMMGITGIEQVIIKCLPFGLSCLLVMTCMSACSISMEGNHFWQIQTLPVTAKEFYSSKILANISVAAPFYLISVIFLGIAVQPVGLDLVWLIVIPVCYMFFTSVAGITANLAFPVLKWENEVRVVKQSASMLVMMLTGMLGSILPLVGVIFAGERNTNLIYILTVILLLALTFLLYRKNNGMELQKISER